MWIFLSGSYLSIVDKGDPSGTSLLVRARLRGDIERVFPDAEVVANAGTDYQFRARVDRERVAQAMADQVRAIRYPNFKATVRDDNRHDAYLDTWRAMMRIRDGESHR